MEKRHTFKWFTVANAILCLGGVALMLLVFPAASPSAPDESARWEEAIRDFEQWDRKNSFPSDAVLFLGSSSIVRWESHRFFPEYPVINRGFGGSQIVDSLYYAERVILPYQPRAVVFYAGDNDIAAGKSVQQVVEDFRSLTGWLHEKLPQTRMIFVGIKPSIARRALWPQMKQANDQIKALCDKDSHLSYFDSATPILNDSGEPDPEFFVKDGLHLGEKGYRAWSEKIRPLIQQVLADPDGSR